jgi:HSP20 family protein
LHIVPQEGSRAQITTQGEDIMTNIAVRKENGNKPAPLATEPRWEPFRVMRDLMGWDPFREMTPFTPQVLAGFAPSFEVKETKDGYSFKADIPGVKESDLEVTVTGNRLSVSGKREAEKQEQTDTYYTYERSYGDFTRAFTLPDGVDMNSVRADLKDGVLTLSINKTPEAQPKKIAVQSAAKKS